jgi:hypothetical protein
MICFVLFSYVLFDSDNSNSIDNINISSADLVMCVLMYDTERKV